MIRIKSFKEMVKNLNIYEPQKIVFAKEGKIINANFNQLSSILFPVNDRVTIKCPDCNHEHTFYVHQEEYFIK